MGTQSRGNIDVAALAGAAVAVSVALFAEKGAYDLYGVITSVTVLLLMFGYIARHERGRLESIAFAAVAALLALPIVGWLLEPDTRSDRSLVSDSAIACAWVVLTVAWLMIDRWYQQRTH